MVAIKQLVLEGRDDCKTGDLQSITLEDGYVCSSGPQTDHRVIGKQQCNFPFVLCLPKECAMPLPQQRKVK